MDGTTLVAAERTGRRGMAIKLDPFYCDVIVRRLTKLTRHKAVLAATGETFEAVAEMRANAAVPTEVVA